jgi:hypothetical protein
MSKIESAGVWEGGNPTCGLTLIVAKEKGFARWDKGTVSWFDTLWSAQVDSEGEVPTLRGI